MPATFFRQNGDLLRGVTTAATLWFVTVIGLCFGGGQIGLGVAGTALALVVLWGLKLVDLRVPVEKNAVLIVTARPEGPASGDVRARLQRAGIQIERFSETYTDAEELQRTIRCNIRWRGLRQDTEVPPTIRDLMKAEGVVHLEWNA